MSASKIAHRRLSGRAGSITQPITIAADVDRGAELIEVCRAAPLDELRALALLRGATAADLRKRETEYGNAPHIVLCVYHDAPAVLEAMLQIVSDPDAKNGVGSTALSYAAAAAAAERAVVAGAVEVERDERRRKAGGQRGDRAVVEVGVLEVDEGERRAGEQ